jgi:hypothetical protein
MRILATMYEVEIHIEADGKAIPVRLYRKQYDISTFFQFDILTLIWLNCIFHGNYLYNLDLECSGDSCIEIFADRLYRKGRNKDWAHFSCLVACNPAYFSL